jgi:glycosyltransferase involved in cell wall biosynthesis
MIKNKVLLVHDYPIVKNEGGPRGYFNKCIYLNEPDNLVSLNDVLTSVKKISYKKKVLVRFDFVRNKIRKFKYKNLNLANKFIKIPSHKFLYFHDIYSFNDIKHLIKENQIVIFQPHSPELPSLEELKNGLSSKKYKEIVKIENLIFNRANFIILPNKECLPIYKSVLSKKHKIFFLQTGIKPIQELSVIPIDNNKINLLYIGRRNEIKGFFSLLTSFRKAVKKRNDIRLIIAGSGDVIRDENIVDLGFTRIAYDWVNSVDFVVSPNKSSYFDLNVIESIAIGTPLIMTTTEGHSFFKNKKGIISVTDNSFYDVLVNKSMINKKYKKEVKTDLFQLYESELSSFVYKKNLEKMCNSIMLENN